MKSLYIETVGCQMNMLDSELVVASLRKQGYELVDTPATADTILFNTCSVRQHAEDKIYSALGRLKHAKKQQPRQDHRRAGLHGPEGPAADLRACPVRRSDRRSRPDAPDSRTARARSRPASGQQLEVSLDRTRRQPRTKSTESFESYDPLRDPQMRPTPYQAFVRIMIGCDKFCTYCIVPMVRGPEQSRPAAQIVAEARKLAAEGCREITLLGQTVNSYKHRARTAARRGCRICSPSCTTSTGIDRLKFVTNYPKDMTRRPAARGARFAQVLALPARAGAKRIERSARADEARLHGRRIPRDAGPHPRDDPGRGGDQRLHRRLLRRDRRRLRRPRSTCVRESRFKNSFIFKYSERPGTKGAELYADDVPEEVKRRRNNELLAIQNAISEEDNQPLIGRDSGSAGRRAQQNQPEARRRRPAAAIDRPHALRPDRGVRRQPPADRPIAAVAIYDANAFTLFGSVVTHALGPEVYALEGVLHPVR